MISLSTISNILKITGLFNDAQFIKLSNADFDVIHGIYYIYDNTRNKEYRLGTFSEINGMNSDEDVINFLSNTMSGNVNITLSEYLKSSGITNARGDYRSNKTLFSYKNETEITKNVKKIIFKLVDSGSFDSGRYGNGITLTNGIRIVKLDASGNEIFNYTKEHIFTNGDITCLADYRDYNRDGSGNEYLAGHFNLNTELQANESIAVVLNDRFTNLIEHKFLIIG